MNADELIQELATSIYEPPLSAVREETDYPALGNPLHLAILLIDCDTEIMMNGMLGFLENMSGDHLAATVEALQVIGAPKCAAVFQTVRTCMQKHGVTWAELRGDFAGTSEYQITSFSELHGESLDDFSTEVCELAKGFQLFNTLYSPEDSYEALCRHLDAVIEQLKHEIQKRKAQQMGAD